ncbi:unnamed protein product [Cladocopium goreaui]|uniref:Pentatricopeptide repeat-containing protein, chloroplastic n=1 Tax=Cladocopium goreaui TaxID=2562237 RepID=A0A9P1G3T3_9DINO|nr:unnamed protein product [Cladocopium goreaui]
MPWRAALLALLASRARGCRFLAELSGATAPEPRALQRHSCEGRGGRYIDVAVTASTGSVVQRFPAAGALAGACVEGDDAGCAEDAELKHHVDTSFANGCRDGHPTLSLLWMQWLHEAVPQPWQPEGYFIFMEKLNERKVPFAEIVSWGALYECPAASCALLAQLTLSSTSPQQLLATLGLPADDDLFLDLAQRMQFCYDEMLTNPHQQQLLTWLGLIVAALELALSKVRAWANALRPRNPHHEEHRLVWHDYYSGLYQAVNYSEQFDLQWKLALERPGSDYALESSVRLDNCALNDMIASTFGQQDYLNCTETQREEHERLERGISRSNFVTLDVSRFVGSEALDVGCGFGRWTAMLQSIGAKVTSVDASPHAVKSTRRFNPNTHQMSLFELPSLENFDKGFDLVICWGVLHHTHDPYKGFKIVSSALREGGVLFIQVYNDRAKAGFHYTQSFRTRFHQLETEEQKLEFLRNTHRAAGADIFDHLDGMLTFYNWVIHEETVRNWFLTNGFAEFRGQ